MQVCTKRRGSQGGWRQAAKRAAERRRSGVTAFERDRCDVFVAQRAALGLQALEFGVAESGGGEPTGAIEGGGFVGSRGSSSVS
jgi:hypothetical protein